MGFLYSYRSLQEKFRHKYVQVDRVKIFRMPKCLRHRHLKDRSPDRMLLVTTCTYLIEIPNFHDRPLRSGKMSDIFF
ncbi:MAG: hypothetical protein HC786_10975 [Richelia sp. CSU_2_1]|nr:hypothetical protein [Richelia sp. CSU_2_1]